MQKIILCLFVACVGWLPSGSAQPTPGKERIVTVFPGTHRGKSSKIPKDTQGIRGTEFTARGKGSESAPVRTVIVTTIDRRYYPMKAAGTPEEKWEFERAGCPDAQLQVLDKKTVDGRTAILYAIEATKVPDGDCGSAVLLTYVAEGPTALHTIELMIPQDQYTPALLKQWSDALLQSRIE